MRSAAYFFGLFALALSTPLHAQQVTDGAYTPQIRLPAYGADGPLVKIDETHRNFHTLNGRYAPFAKLLRADGYEVRRQVETISTASLEKTDVLVIANARRSEKGTPAFPQQEIDDIKRWVENGGSLFLIADHAPFGKQSASLASVFGVNMGKGYVAVSRKGKISSTILYRGDRLGKHPIFLGKKSDGKIRTVQSFTGQSLGLSPDAPLSAAALLTIPKGALEVADREMLNALRHGKKVQGLKVGGRAQALALSYGKGRVVVAGEAAMFTAQRMTLKSGKTNRVGLRAAQNEQFTLNVLHWLTRNIN